MEIEWVTLEEFPNYILSNQGDIINKTTGKWIKHSKTLQGALKVGLFVDGMQYTRSVKVLVAEAFLEGKDEIFDTPIHLDGDQNNVRIDNLVWRPRWFAWEYSRQMSNLSDKDYLGPLREINTRDIYVDVYEAGTTNGLLFVDIRKSTITDSTVFPTFMVFEWV